MYKILIADDHPLFREAIHNVISDGFPGSEVMETADLDSALALTQDHDDLDLILLDLNMPGMHGLNGLINLRNEAPTIPVVIVSADAAAVHQAVINVLDAARRANLSRVSFATQDGRAVPR